MQNKSIAILLAAMGAAALIPTAQAEFEYQSQDLLISFREAGVVFGTPTPGPNNITINLGNVYDFLSDRSGVGVTYDLGSYLTGVNFGDVKNLFNVTFDGTIYFSAAAVDTSANDLWASRARTGSPSDTEPGSDPWLRQGGVTQALAVSGINPVGTGAQANGADYSDVATKVGNTLPVSYATLVNDGAQGTYGNYFVPSPGVEGSLRYDQTTARIDLWELPVKTSGFGVEQPGDFLGFFTFTSGNELTFTAVPEPSVYGLIGGGGLLLVALRRRLLGQSV